MPLKISRDVERFLSLPEFSVLLHAIKKQQMDADTAKRIFFMLVPVFG
jgi:hypothetical protein